MIEKIKGVHSGVWLRIGTLKIGLEGRGVDSIADMVQETVILPALEVIS